MKIISLLIFSLFIFIAYSLPLGLKEESNVTSDIVGKIASLETEPLNHIIRRVLKDHKDVSLEYAKSSRISFLRWASLQYFTEESLVPSLKVDRFWHAFLMFTDDYQKWCDGHFGKFMHHYPDDSGDEESEDDASPAGCDHCGSCKNKEDGKAAGCDHCGSCKNKEDGKSAGCDHCGSCKNNKEESEKPGWILSTKLMFELYGEDWSERKQEEKSAGCCDDCSNGKENIKSAKCCDGCSNGKKENIKSAKCCDGCSNGKKENVKSAKCCDGCSNGKKENIKSAKCCDGCSNGKKKRK